jgi:hypothetical protein
MNNEYKFKNELKTTFSDYNFSEQMRHDSLNSIWRQKEGLWKLLSASCNDAALECYEAIQQYTDKLVDVETCTIHALKSISKSVDLEFLTKNLKEDYPVDVLKLINLMSVPRHLLLNTNRILHTDTNMKIFGEIAKRGSKIVSKSVPVDLLYDIKTHCYELLKILENHGIYKFYNLTRCLKEDLPDLIIKYSLDKTILNIDLNYPDYDVIINMTLGEIIEKINDLRFEDLQLYKNQVLKLNESDTSLNYFYLLINIIKQNFYNQNLDVFIDGFYFDNVQNKTVDLSTLIMRIVSDIDYHNDVYINKFICYHFYNLFKSKLCNDSIRCLFELNRNKNKIIMKTNLVSEMTEDEFKEKLKSFISEEAIESFIEKNNITIFTNSIVTFIEYLSFINLYNGLNNKNDSDEEIEYDLISLNFNHIEAQNVNKDLYERIIGNVNKSGECLSDSAVMNIAKELSDISIHISYLREDIKNNIQKYSIIGTKKIVLDNLNEFFIKNYSDNSDWNYQSNFVINHYENYLSTLFKPIGVLKNEYNFSINLIEYFDTTNYLNIESEMGEVKVGEEVVGYQTEEQFYLDDDNLIASAVVESPIYKDVYAPCSNFLGNSYNDKFWETADITVNSDEQFKKYIQYYDQYFVDCKEKINDYDKRTYISEKVMPFIEKVWEEFALSGYSELSNDSEVGELFRKYIGNDFGENKFLNHENTLFPTIAPFQNIDGLIEVNDFDNDILFVSKFYYKNVIESIINYTKTMLKMYNDDGVPYDGWKQSYINFHGYSTKYEYSQKLTSQLKNSNKLIDVDGPWSYSILQNIYYNHYENNNLNDIINELVQYTDVVDDDVFSLSSLFNEYLNGEKNGLFFDENDSIKSYKIGKIAYDMFNNCYSLLKKDDNVCGKLLFRSFETSISLPLSEFIEYNGNYGELLVILNNCIDFEIYDDFMWVYGKYEHEYRLFSFKLTYEFNHIILEDNSLVFHSTNYNKEIYNLNDFICASYNEDTNEINFIFINQFEELFKLRDVDDWNRERNLKSSNLNFYVTTVDISKNLKNIRILDVKNVVFPMLLQHIDNDQIFENNRRIWKHNVVNLTNYICYEALNTDIWDKFLYYYNLSENVVNLEVLNISWDVNNVFVKDFELVNAKNIKVRKGERLSINLNSAQDLETLNKTIFNKINEYPKCYIKNGNLNVDIIPLSLFNEFSNYYQDFTDSIISIIEEGYSNNVNITFNNFGEMITDIKLRQQYNDSLDYINRKQFLIKDETFLNTNFEINSESNELYKYIPVSRNCLFEPLKIIILFENESGVTFFDDFALDVDLTCYINDKIERNKRVGYGNKYKETQYINWSGDNNSKEFETLEIDVFKYLKNNNLNKLIDDEMEIVLNICWYNESQIRNGNVYAIINWQNVFQKLPLNNIGINGKYEKPCETKSLTLKINKNDLILTYDVPKQYFAFKFALKEKLNGIEDGIPDFQCGLIGLDNKDLYNIETNPDWFKYDDKYLLYYNKDVEKTGTSNFRYCTVILKDDVSIPLNESMIYREIKRIVDSIIFIGTPFNGNEKMKKLFNWNDLRLDDIYFGMETINVDKETDINYTYFGYVNPKFYSKSLLMTSSNYQILDIPEYPILISVNEDLRKCVENMIKEDRGK